MHTKAHLQIRRFPARGLRVTATKAGLAPLAAPCLVPPVFEQWTAAKDEPRVQTSVDPPG